MRMRSIKSQKLGEINYLLAHIYNFEVYGNFIEFRLPPEIGRKAWATYCHITELYWEIENEEKGFICHWPRRERQDHHL